MNSHGKEQGKLLRDRVISFRVNSQVADALERWAAKMADPKVNTADKMARKLMLEALPPGLENGLFEGAITDQVPEFDVVVGSAATTLRRIKSEIVDVIVTSPPYFLMRRYSTDPREIGRERDAQQYIARLMDAFRECWRVLKPHGTMWIVIDDAYSKKQLLGLPWRLMSALQAEGWIVRAEQVWAKSGMCEGAQDRTTRDHEFVFLLTKRPKGYHYDSDAIREPFASKWSLDCINKARENGVVTRPKTNPFSKQERREKGHRGITRSEYGALMNPLGRNRRSIWEVTTAKLKEEHYAAFPVELAKICIRAGCPSGGTCLDPFAGAGSTGIAAVATGRKFLGIELVDKYAEIARGRIRDGLALQPVQ